jgi:hypothetical protein
MKKIKFGAEKNMRQTGGRLIFPARKLFGGNQFFVFAVLLSVALSLACTPRSFEKPNVTATPPASPATAEDKQASFQNELKKMKTADLQFIFVFRRKDDAEIDGEDRKYLKTNLPFYNRLVFTDDDKAVIIGSNYKFPPENLEVLRLRFKVEDFSSADDPAK